MCTTSELQFLLLSARVSDCDKNTSGPSWTIVANARAPPTSPARMRERSMWNRLSLVPLNTPSGSKKSSTGSTEFLSRAVTLKHFRFPASFCNLTGQGVVRSFHVNTGVPSERHQRVFWNSGRDWSHGRAIREDFAECREGAILELCANRRDSSAQSISEGFAQKTICRQLRSLATKGVSGVRFHREARPSRVLELRRRGGPVIQERGDYHAARSPGKQHSPHWTCTHTGRQACGVRSPHRSQRRARCVAQRSGVQGCLR